MSFGATWMEFSSSCVTLTENADSAAWSAGSGISSRTVGKER